MKRILALLITTAAVTTSLSAGLTYDFRSVSQGAGASQLSGRASIDGDRLRMDVSKGDGSSSRTTPWFCPRMVARR